MRKKEKFSVSIVAIALGVLLIAMQGTTIQVITSILGILLMVLGGLDLIAREILLGVAKLAVGIFFVGFGWLILSVIFYIIAIVLLVVAAWWIYELWRVRCIRPYSFSSIFAYVQPILITLVGILLFFHQGEERAWIFIFAGIVTIIEGALLLATSIKTIE